MNINGYNPYWWFMYKVFKIRRPLPKDFMDFDEVIFISDEAKKGLMSK